MQCKKTWLAGCAALLLAVFLTAAHAQTSTVGALVSGDTPFCKMPPGSRVVAMKQIRYFKDPGGDYRYDIGRSRSSGGVYPYEYPTGEYDNPIIEQGTEFSPADCHGDPWALRASMRQIKPAPIKEHGKLTWIFTERRISEGTRPNTVAEFRAWSNGHFQVVHGDVGAGTSPQKPIPASKSEPARTIALTRVPDPEIAARERAAQQSRADAEYKKEQDAKDQRIAKEAADRQVVAFDRELKNRQQCALPHNQGSCNCGKYQAQPPGGRKTCDK